MKNIKRHLSALLALVLLASLLFGCNFTPADTDQTTESTVTTEPANKTYPTLKINGVELSSYTGVFNRASSSGAYDALIYLSDQLVEQFGVEMERTNMYAGSEDRYEIVVGTDEKLSSVSTAYKNCKGGLIAVSGNKIFLLAENNAALRQVVDAFLAKITGTATDKEINVTKNEEVKLTVETFKFLTYNVQQDLYKAGRSKNCLQEMVNTISEANPDVFGTQEDTSTISAYFVKNLNGYSCYQGLVEPKRDSYDCVYWKTSKFELVKKGFYYLSATPNSFSKYPGSNGYRTYSYVILKSKATGVQFLFACVHTDYRSDEDTRVLQMKALTDTLKTLNPTGMPMVLLGDFNTTPIKEATTSFLNDNPNIDLTLFSAKTFGDTGGTLATTEFTVRSDYIFDMIYYTTDSAVAQYYSVLDNIVGKTYPSDHLPVVATIDLYKKG